jgi:putative flippase GtrA
MIRRALHYQRQLTGESFFGTARRYFIFVLGGLIGWLILIGTHIFFRDTYHLHPALSYGIGMFFATIFTFVYHVLVTFRIKTRLQSRFVQFSVLVVLIAILNWGMFSFSRVVLNLPISDTIISFFITGFLSVVNFGINRIIIFRNH